MKFAQILNGTAHWIFDADKPPEFAPNIVIVDITKANPTPQEGWLYDGVTFTPAPRPPLAPIAPADLINLFTPTEFEAIDTAAKTNPKASAFFRWLQFTPSVSSANPRIVNVFTAMVNAGILTPARRDEILGSFG